VKLTNLAPNVTYYYTCGAADSYWSPQYNFTTPPLLYSAGVYRFAVLGDMGSIMPMGIMFLLKILIYVGWAVNDQMIADNQQFPFNMIIHVGDIAYAGIGETSELQELWV
jgi:hypothetical protein